MYLSVLLVTETGMGWFLKVGGIPTHQLSFPFLLPSLPHTLSLSLSLTHPTHAHIVLDREVEERESEERGSIRKDRIRRERIGRERIRRESIGRERKRRMQ